MSNNPVRLHWSRGSHSNHHLATSVLRFSHPPQLIAHALGHRVRRSKWSARTLFRLPCRVCLRVRALCIANKASPVLQDPSVASAPLEKRIAFLQSKNLTQEEVDISLARAAEDHSLGAVSPQSSTPPSNVYRSPPAARAYGGPPAQGYWQSPPSPPE